MKPPLSNPLRQAFAENKPAGPHPDASLLSGFAEGALTRRERDGVLAHLATCAECREVLGLAATASPQTAEEQGAPTIRPAVAEGWVKRGPLWSWLPWAASAAAIVVVASAVLVRELPRNAYEEPQKVVVVTPAPQPPSAEAGKSAPAERATESGAIALSAEKKQEPQAKPDSIDMTARNSDKVVIGTPLPGSSAKQQADREADLSAQARLAERSAPAAAKGEAAGVIADSNSRYVYSNQASSNQVYKSQVYSNQGASNQAAANKVQKLPETVTVESAAAQAEVAQDNAFAGAPPAPAMAPQAMRSKTLAKASARPHWRIDEAGHLQRSVADGVWQPVLANEPARFRVVAVVGSDVWAGGEKSVLCHSTDNGTSWQNITLPQKNGAAHAITRIRFQTERAGTIETEDGTTWTTTNGGKSWK